MRAPGQYTPSVQTAPIARPTPSIRPADASPVAQGLAAVGTGLADATDAVSRAHAVKTIAEARSFWAKETLNREQSATGAAEGYADTLEADFEKWKAQTLETAPTPARGRIASALTEYGGVLAAQATVFEAKKRVAFQSEAILQAVDANRNALLDDPRLLETTLQDTLTAIEESGLPDDVRIKLAREARSGLALSATQGLISRNPSAALNRLQAGELDGLLDPDRKAALIRSAEMEIRSRAAEARSIAAARRQEYLEGFEDELAFVAAGNTPPPDSRYTQDRLTAELGQERGREAWRLYGQALEDSDNLFVLMHGGPEEIAERRAILAQETQDAEGFRAAQDRLSRFDRQAVAVARSLAEDPVQAVLSQSRFAAHAGEMLDGTPEGTANYARLVLGAQADRGIPAHARGLLTQGQSSALVAEVQRLPAAERGAQMRRLADQWGEHWPVVLRQMREAELDPATYHAALVADDLMLSERVAALADAGPRVLAEGLPPAEVTAIEADVFDEMAEFRTVFEAGDATGAAATEFNRLFDVAKGVALQLYRAGDADAARTAVDRIIGRRYSVVDDGTVMAYVPSRHDADLIASGARAMLSPERIEAFDPAPFGMEDGLPDDVARARMAQAARNGVWVTNERADGLVLMVDIDGRMLPLRDRQGRRYEATFSEIGMASEGTGRRNAIEERADRAR